MSSRQVPQLFPPEFDLWGTPTKIGEVSQKEGTPHQGSKSNANQPKL